MRLKFKKSTPPDGCSFRALRSRNHYGVGTYQMNLKERSTWNP
jgi:hypothetical protein